MGHKTSISLEGAFWSLLKGSAQAQNLSLPQLIAILDQTRTGSLASALRLHALAYALKKTDDSN